MKMSESLDILMMKNDAKTIKLNDRLLMILYKTIPETYESYLYMYELVQKKDQRENTVGYYIGYHTGNIDDFETQKYTHSSKNKKFKLALENSDLIKYHILDFGYSWEMGTMEHKLMKEVNAKNNKMFFNNNNGGGSNCITAGDNLKTVDIISQKIKNGEYCTKLYDKNILKRVSENPKSIQARHDQISSDHVRILRDKMHGKKAKDFDPITVLLPKDKNETPRLLDGNHSIAAALSSEFMEGLYTYEIPYDEWSHLFESELHSLALRLNPQPEKISMPTSIFDAANWVVSTIEEKSLFKPNNNMLWNSSQKEPLFDHPYIKENLIKMGFTISQRGAIRKKAEIVYALNRGKKLGSNFIDWREESLNDANNNIMKNWLNTQINHYRDTMGYDENCIIKISANQDLLSQIDKKLFSSCFSPDGKIKDIPKRALVLLYFTDPNLKTSDIWKKNRQKFDYIYNKGFKNIIELNLLDLPEYTDQINLSGTDA